MPVSQMRNGLTAENSIFSQKPSVSVSRSRFDFGRFKAFTCDIGAIVPVDCFETLPNTDYNLSCQYKIDWRPLLVPTLTPYKVKVHYYFCPNEYLCSGWETFITKGRSGNLKLEVPKIKLASIDNTTVVSGLTDPNFKTTSGDWKPYGPHSLASYLCGKPHYIPAVDQQETSPLYLPYVDDSVTLTETGFHTLDTNILPFIMYQKIYRSNYMDPNLYANGKFKSDVWFPEDIDSTHWRVNYAGTNVGGSLNHLFVPDTIANIPSSNIVANFVPFAQNTDDEDSVYDNVVNLLQLRYSMYTDDMFTTALPFLQRGEQTTLDLDVVDSVINSTVNGDNASLSGTTLPGQPTDDFIFFGIPSVAADGTNIVTLGAWDSTTKNLTFNFSGYGEPDTRNISFIMGNLQGVSVSSTMTGAKVNLTAQKLRDLIAVSVWQERNALTNGSYGQFVKVHFNSYPRNQFCEPIYIGGTTSTFNVNAILQTSESNLEKNSPQGNPVGVGGSSQSQSIGHFRSDDYGFIMVLMTIIPDTLYVQSNEHWQYATTPDDYYSPEYERLSYQPIPNKMLLSTGNAETDDDLFAYSNRYVYLKQRDSMVTGMFALPPDVDAYYHSYVQARIFADTPTLSQQFVTVYPPNIDRSMLAYPSQPAFLCQFASNVDMTAPMSYLSQPNTFGF